MCTNLQELKSVIDLAIKDCEKVVKKNPKAILSEGDFERLLSFYISKRIGYNPKRPNPDAFAIHSQISHYNNDNNIRNAVVDLLLIKPRDIEECYDHNKGFIHKAESFVIELKYQYIKEKGVDRIKRDIRKYVKYKDDSYYYTVILLDEGDNTSKYEKEILSYYEKKKKELGNEYENKFFCKVLKKKPE